MTFKTSAMARPTILVVEDNDITRKLVRVTLVGEGYTVLEAPDGRTAIELTRTRSPDLILQDLLLPDIDGFDLLLELRALPDTAAIPIVAFSGFLSRLESARALSLGFTDFLSKPVAPSHLLETIRPYLAAPTPSPAGRGRGKRALVADDDPVGLKLARTHLRHLGFEVVTARDGAEALRLARHSPPDVILSDVLMPNMDGFQLCLAVRKDARLKDIPVVLCTANYIEDRDRRLAAGVGASAAIMRTAGMEEAVQAVIDCLERSVAPAPEGHTDLLESERIHRVVRQLERQVMINAGLGQRVALQAAILTLVAGLPDSVARAIDLEGAPGDALAGILDAGGVSMGAIYLIQGDGTLTLQTQAGFGPESSAVTDMFGHPEVFARVASQGHGIALPSSAIPEDAALGLLARAKVGSVVIMPLASRGESLGVLLLASQRRDLTHPDWLAFARSISAQLAQTLALGRAFARLSASEGRYHSLFDGTPIGLFRITPEGEFIEANPTLVALLGCPDRDSLLALRVHDFYLDSADWRRFLSDREREGTALGFEVRLRRRDGVIIWARVNSRRVQEAGRVVYEGSFEDITDRRLGELRMMAEHEVTRALAESASLAEAAPRVLEAICTSLEWQAGEIWGVDAVAGVLRRFDAWHLRPDDFRDISNRTRDVTYARGVGMVGRAWETGAPVWIADMSREPAVPRWSMAAQAGLRGGFSFPIRVGAEVLGVLAFFSDQIREPDEALLRMVASVGAQIGQSMERWRAETEVARQRDVLAQTEKVAAMGQLLAGVAHELNNPLSVVLGQAALLRNQVKGGPLDERAVKITTAADRCARIIRNFLALARQRPAQREQVDIHVIVQEAMEMLAYPLRVDSIEIALDLDAGIAPFSADANQLHQVLVNLVTNAHHVLRGHPRPRRITITTRADAQRKMVILSVADNGPGIPPEIRTRIFEPFFTTKAVGEGTGLGLSLCQGIVEAHGGVLTQHEATGGGAIFRVELPVQPLPVQEVATTSGVEDAPITGKRILVVDDEEEVCAILVELLAVDGHEVDTANNGVVALERIRRQRYDLVVSDLRMPEMDGPSLYHAVEAERPDLARRFIFITGDTLGTSLREFLEAERRVTVTKPFNVEEMLGVIRKALRESAGP